MTRIGTDPEKCFGEQRLGAAFNLPSLPHARAVAAVIVSKGTIAKCSVLPFFS